MGMKKLFSGILLAAAACLSALPAGAPAGEILVAAASDLRFAMKDLAAAFEKDRPGTKVRVVYGSSGTFYAQIRNGAPFDLFLSADMDYPERLREEGFAAAPTVPYAVGSLVLWTRKDAGLDLGKGMSVLLDPGVDRIAVANPHHAPYGMRAKESLVHYGLWDAVRRKLVFGENVAQAAQFVRTGNARAGILSLSLAAAPPMREAGIFVPIDPDSHRSLEQGYLVLRRAVDNGEARALARFMESAAAREILASHGFAAPGDR
jgi:molybdate transport system substrate-binding protein